MGNKICVRIFYSTEISALKLGRVT